MSIFIAILIVVNFVWPSRFYVEVIEGHLNNCLERITSAEQNSVDAYVYFFSCLKLSELNMLQTAARSDLAPAEKVLARYLSSPSP